MTLLILEIKVPKLDAISDAGLIVGLRDSWPSFVAFVMSFFVILIMWMNHHELFRMVRKTDGRFLFANGFLMLMVTFIPFPTAVLAQYLGTPAAETAAAFYCASFCGISLGYNLLFLSIAHKRRLVRPEIADATLASIRHTYTLGAVVYVAAVVGALVNAWLGLGICTSLWIVWIHMAYLK